MEYAINKRKISLITLLIMITIGMLTISLVKLQKPLQAAASANAGKLIINEVAITDSTNDWVELYVVDGSVDWTGYRIYEGTTCQITIPACGASFQSGDYVILHEEAGTDDVNKSDNNPNYWDLYVLTDLFSTDQIIQIKEPLGSTARVDAFIYSNNNADFTGSDAEANGAVTDSMWDAGASFNGKDSDAWIDSDYVDPSKSMGRDRDFTNNNSKSNWHLYTTIHTKGARNGSLVINEVLYDPSGVDTGKEWIELYNDSGSSIDLTGYDLGIYESGGTSAYYTFPSFTLSGGGYVVVHWRKEGADTSTDLYTGTAAPFDDNMHNTRGYGALFNSTTHSSTTIVDYLEYGAGGQTWESDASDAGIWDTGDYIGNVTEGWVIARLPNGTAGKGYDNNQPEDWQGTNDPTPGSANELSAIKIIIQKWRELYH